MAGIILQQAIIMLILNVVGMIAYYTGIVSRGRQTAFKRRVGNCNAGHHCARLLGGRI